MKLLAILTFFSFFLNQVAAQTSATDLEKVVSQYINELHESGIDTVLVYEDYCTGCLHTWKRKRYKCDSDGLYVPTYIFWKSKEQTFVTRKDNCFGIRPSNYILPAPTNFLKF